MATLSQLKEKIATATYRDALTYDGGSVEKYLYCLDWLEISANASFADKAVNLLEDKFDEILSN